MLGLYPQLTLIFELQILLTYQQVYFQPYDHLFVLLYYNHKDFSMKSSNGSDEIC